MEKDCLSSIRLKKESDLQALQKTFENIRKQLSSERLAEFNWPPEKVAEAFFQYNFLLSFNSAAIESQTIVKAFIGFQEISDDVEIIVLATDPDFRRQKTMRKLFDFFVQKICKKNSKIFLEVHEINAVASNFYLNVGFQIDGRRNSYYTDGSAAINMSYQVKPD